MLDLVDERHLVSGVLVLDRLEDVWRDHAGVRGPESGFDRVSVEVALRRAGRVVAIEATRLSNHAIRLDVIEGDEGSPKRGLCRAEGCSGQQETKKQETKGLQGLKRLTHVQVHRQQTT